MQFSKYIVSREFDLSKLNRDKIKITMLIVVILPC
jgi:hypothetical protein